MDLLFPLDSDIPPLTVTPSAAPMVVGVGIPSFVVGIVSSVAMAVSVPSVTTTNPFVFHATPVGITTAVQQVTYSLGSPQIQPPPVGMTTTAINAGVTGQLLAAPTTVPTFVTVLTPQVLIGGVSVTPSTFGLLVAPQPAIVQTSLPIQIANPIPISVFVEDVTISDNVFTSASPVLITTGVNSPTVVNRGQDQTITISSPIPLTVTPQPAFTGGGNFVATPASVSMRVEVNMAFSFNVKTGGHLSSYATLVETGQTGVKVFNG